MEIPEWLKIPPHPPLVKGSKGGIKEKFLDKTLRHIVSFTEDTMFNERISLKNGFLQKIEPRIKVLTIIFFIILLSLQKSLYSISAFFLVSLALAFISRIPLLLFIQRILPAFLFTLLISMPAALNLIVNGEPIIRLFIFKSGWSIGTLDIPQEIFVTKQGLLSAVTLLLKVTASVSLVFLLTLTTPPNRFIKAVSSFMPGAFKSIVSISYRYIFFLIRRVEEFLIAYKSRTITTIKISTKHRWIASRIGFLFSLSIKLSQDLEKAMDSRNYKFGVRSLEFGLSLHASRFTIYDLLWVIFSIIFTGVMLWKSLN